MEAQFRRDADNSVAFDISTTILPRISNVLSSTAMSHSDSGYQLGDASDPSEPASDNTSMSTEESQRWILSHSD